MIDELAPHIARLLVLTHAFGPRGGGIDGLTKIAKLDFLLRYPTFLERLLERRGIDWPEGLAPTSSERRSVESRMIRYKYGPWDHRYYVVISALVGLGLATYQRQPDGRQLLALTSQGRAAARSLRGSSWGSTGRRADLLKSHFDLPGNALRTVIYTELPDVLDRPFGAAI